MLARAYHSGSGKLVLRSMQDSIQAHPAEIASNDPLPEVLERWLARGFSVAKALFGFDGAACDVLDTDQLPS